MNFTEPAHFYPVSQCSQGPGFVLEQTTALCSGLLVFTWQETFRPLLWEEQGALPASSPHETSSCVQCPEVTSSFQEISENKVVLTSKEVTWEFSSGSWKGLLCEVVIWNWGLARGDRHAHRAVCLPGKLFSQWPFSTCHLQWFCLSHSSWLTVSCHGKNRLWGQESA